MKGLVLTLFCNFLDKFKLSHLPGLSFDMDFFPGLKTNLDTLGDGCVGDGVVKNVDVEDPEVLGPGVLGEEELEFWKLFSKLCLLGKTLETGIFAILTGGGDGEASSLKEPSSSILLITSTSSLSSQRRLKSICFRNFNIFPRP